jgi:hypothetical protein
MESQRAKANVKWGAEEDLRFAILLFEIVLILNPNS